MSDRSLRVHPDWIKTVKSRYQSRYANQKDLAKDAEIGSVDTVSKFLNGKPISRDYFWMLCDLLDLTEDREIITKDRHSSNQPSPASTKVQRDDIPASFPSAGNEDKSQLHRISSVLENPNFIGRKQELGYLGHLSCQDYKCILLLAPGGVGKTTLARHFLKQQFGTYIEFAIAKEQQNIASAASLVEEKLRQLGEEPGREFYVSLERLKFILQTQRIGVLVDNLEPALNEHGQFLDEHREYVDLLRVLCDPSLQSLTLITSREPLYESLDIHTLLLPSLSLEDWEAFFAYHSIQIDFSILSKVHRAYDGNALAMKVLCNPIKQFYNGDITAYWHDCKTETDLVIEKSIENLIKEQFNRLQKINFQAYKLLCRMGCYRYQDVLTVPINGVLCLLWDVPEGKRKLVDTLIRCLLIEYKDNEYWLHPIIRAEAIARLRISEDWKTANCKAAEFWTHKIHTVDVVEDAIRAYEAYYHYFEINDFEQAANIIVKNRDNKVSGIGSLGRSFFRLGLMQQMITGIEQIINYINNELSSVKLYNILGDLYWMTGYIHKAINCHIRSGEIINHILNNLEGNISFNFGLELEEFRCSYLLNMALCKIDLGELEESEAFLKRLLSQSKNHIKTQISACFCLAFVNSCFGHKNIALDFAHKSQEFQWDKVGSWTTGYGFIFLGLTYKNLESIEKSFEMYYKGIDFAEKIHYTQVKAKAINGIAELYRKQEEFAQAISKHNESIEILKALGAKFDLTEAYFQMGLTYYTMGEVGKSLEYRDKAIQLFTEMEAPRQAERVKQAFANIV